MHDSDNYRNLPQCLFISDALFFLVEMFMVIITNQTLKFKGWLSQTKENDIYYSYQKIMQMEKLKIQVRCSLVNASKVIKESKNTCTHNVIEEKWGFLTGKRKKSSGTRTKTLTGPFLTYRWAILLHHVIMMLKKSWNWK